VGFDIKLLTNMFLSKKYTNK